MRIFAFQETLVESWMLLDRLKPNDQAEGLLACSGQMRLKITDLRRVHRHDTQVAQRVLW